jgi:hypothetical protein
LLSKRLNEASRPSVTPGELVIRAEPDVLDPDVVADDPSPPSVVGA